MVRDFCSFGVVAFSGVAFSGSAFWGFRSFGVVAFSGLLGVSGLVRAEHVCRVISVFGSSVLLRLDSKHASQDTCQIR